MCDEPPVEREYRPDDEAMIAALAALLEDEER